MKDVPPLPPCFSISIRSLLSFPVYTCLFSLTAFTFFLFIMAFKQFHYDVTAVVLFMFLKLGVRCAFIHDFIIFVRFGEFSAKLPQFFSPHFPSGPPITHILGHGKVSHIQPIVIFTSK